MNKNIIFIGIFSVFLFLASCSVFSGDNSEKTDEARCTGLRVWKYSVAYLANDTSDRPVYLVISQTGVDLYGMIVAETEFPEGSSNWVQFQPSAFYLDPEKQETVMGWNGVSVAMRPCKGSFWYEVVEKPEGIWGRP